MENPYLISIGKYCYGLFCFLLTSIVFGQTPHPSFFHYTTEDGLPSSECYEIIQDKKGYIWISGDNGVSRFDGQEFKNYGTEEGLVDKTILTMKEDHRGWIWLSSFSGKLYLIRGDSITPYPYNDRLLAERDRFYLTRDFTVDTSGTLHLALANLGIMTIDSNGQSTLIGRQQFSTNGAYINANKVMLFNELSPNVNLEKRAKTLNYINREKLSFDLIYGTDQDTTIFIPIQLIENKNKDILATYGLQLFSFPDRTFLLQIIDYLYLFDHQGNYTYSKIGLSSINCMLQMKDGRLLAGMNSKEGLRLYNSKADLLANRAQNTYFSNYTITHILEDRQGGIWLSTLESGIFYLPAIDVKVVHPNFNNEIARQVNQMAVLSDSIAILKYQDNIFETTDKTGRTSLYTRMPAEMHIPVLGYLPEYDLLFITPHFYYKTDRWQDVDYHRPIKSHHNKLRTGPLKVGLENQPRIWTSEYFNKAVLLELSFVDDKVSVIQRFEIPDRPKIRTIQPLGSGTFAIGDMNGLYVYDIKQKTILPIPLLQQIKGRINELSLTPKGELVVATHGEGIIVLSENFNQRRNITQQEGLLSNTITTLLTDTLGQVWAGSRKGINKIILRADTFVTTNYTTAFGLPTDNIDDLDQWGRHVAATTSKGITLFPLIDTSYNQLTSDYNFEVFLHNQAIELTDHQRFSYRENTFRFVFYYLDYRYRSNLKYRYRLRPQEEWATSSSREFLLANLAPDDYILEVEIQVPGTTYTPLYRLPFTVSPPFWQLNWVRWMIFLIILTIAYSLINSRIKRLRQEGTSLKLEEEVKTLRQQAYRAQMNPHFIFNCLSTIQGMIMGDVTEQDAAVRMIARFSQLIRQALDASNEEHVTLEEELKLLNNYLELEQLRFNHSFRYEIIVDPTLESDWIKIPPMLVQPFVENAVLHGMEDKQGDGKIVVEYLAGQRCLHVNVIDNGPGISVTKAQKATNPSKYSHKSLGMTITQRRLAILNAEDYQVAIEEPRDENGTIRGTIVRLRVPL